MNNNNMNNATNNGTINTKALDFAKEISDEVIIVDKVMRLFDAELAGIFELLGVSFGEFKDTPVGDFLYRAVKATCRNIVANNKTVHNIERIKTLVERECERFVSAVVNIDIGNVIIVGDDVFVVDSDSAVNEIVKYCCNCRYPEIEPIIDNKLGTVGGIKVDIRVAHWF